MKVEGINVTLAAPVIRPRWVVSLSKLKAPASRRGFCLVAASRISVLGQTQK
jgi:hypothetical protein